jgi:hypothetical protein
MSDVKDDGVVVGVGDEEAQKKFLRHLMLTLEVETDDLTRCDGCAFREVDIWGTPSDMRPAGDMPSVVGERMLWVCAAPAPWGGSDVTESRPEECMDAEAPF